MGILSGIWAWLNLLWRRLTTSAHYFVARLMYVVPAVMYGN